MHEPIEIENMYFNWLCAKVLYLENPTPSLRYDMLLRILHSTEFAWLITGDDNRAEDGLELREDFLLESGLPEIPEWQIQPCSLLEMLIAFSKRAEFMTSVRASEWFWEFIDNLGLLGFNDASGATPDEIGYILFQFIWRQYSYNGRGGLFPLENPPEDQTNVQIWYQFCEYLTDQDRMP